MIKSCQDTTELLPWLLNGSLEGEERRAVCEHLAGCESCRGELAESSEAWQMFAQHVPSLALAEYAVGMAPSAPDRERIERHLALCPSCRQELELAMSDRVVDFAAAREAREETPRRRRAASVGDRVAGGRALAIAASFALLLVSGLTIRSFVGTDGTTPREPIVAETAEPEAATGAASLFSNGFESGDTAAWTKTSQAGVDSSDRVRSSSTLN